jgi:hypothetical protein
VREFVLALCWGVALTGVLILLGLGFSWVVDRIYGREEIPRDKDADE